MQNILGTLRKLFKERERERESRYEGENRV